MEINILEKELHDSGICKIAKSCIPFPNLILYDVQTYTNRSVPPRPNILYICHKFPNIPEGISAFNFIVIDPDNSFIPENSYLQPEDEQKINYMILEPETDTDKLHLFLEKLFQDDQKLMTAIQPLMEALLKDRGLQELSDLATGIFGNPFWIIDMNFNYLTTPSGHISDPVILQEMQQGYLTERTVMFQRREKVREKIHRLNEAYAFPAMDSGHNMMMIAIKIRGITVAYANMFEEHHEFATYDFRMMNKVAEILSTEMQKDSYFKSNKGITFSYMLTDLLTDRVKKFNDITSRLETLGFHIYEYCYLLSVPLETPHLREMNINHLTEQFQYILKNCIYCSWHHTLVFLYTSSKPFDASSSEFKRLSQYLSDSGYRCGVSDPFSDLQHLPEYFNQTVQAVTLGTARREALCLYLYTDYVIDHILDMIKDSVSFNSLCRQALPKLIRYDREYHTDLVDTLEIYLNCNLQIVPASQKMGLHSNTLRYRISKIREISGCPLENGDESLELMLALRLYRLFENR